MNLRQQGLKAMSLLLPLLAWAQPDTLWTKQIDSDYADYASEVLNTTDAGFLVASSQMGFGMDFRIREFDASGNIIWSRGAATGTDDWCATIVPALSDGWLTCGWTYPEASPASVMLVRFDADGEQLWWRRIGGEQTAEEAHAILPLANGGFLVAGEMDVSMTGMTDVYLIRITDQGDTLWTRRYASPGIEVGTAIVATDDGNALIAGSYHATTSEPMDCYFLKITLDGDAIWSRTFGTAGNEILSQALPSADGGVVFAGTTEALDPFGDMFLGKIDSNGDSVWVRTFGGEGEDRGWALTAMNDGGFALCGRTTSFGDPSSDGYLVRTDSDGNLIWSYVYGTPDVYESFEALKASADGGLIVVGNRAAGPEVPNMFLVRLDNELNADSPPTLPNGFSLHQNYPNPFNPRTTVSFDLPVTSWVDLSIYNVLGQRVATVMHQTLDAGTHTVAFDGSSLASGVYVYRLEGQGFVSQKKMALMK